MNHSNSKFVLSDFASLVCIDDSSNADTNAPLTKLIDSIYITALIHKLFSLIFVKYMSYQ